MNYFLGLNTALSALQAQRKGMEVTGQNIANSTTEGYVRQRVDMAAAGAPTRAAMWSRYSGAGSGVVVESVTRIKDAFVEARLQQANGALERTTVRGTALTRLEQVFGEPTGQGLQTLLDDVFSGFGDVANNPGDLAAREQLMQRLNTAGGWLNEASAQFSDQFRTTRDQLGAVVNQVNTLASGIAELNKTITQSKLNGISVNELEEQREALTMQLTGLVGGTTKTDPETGATNVYVGGTALVQGSAVQEMVLSGPDKLGAWVGPPDVAANDPSANMVKLTWAKDGQPVQRLSGSAAGMVENLNEDLPRFSRGLDKVVANFVSAVNNIHSQGYGLSDATKRNLLDPAGVTAETFRIDPSMLTAAGDPDPRKLAASGAPPVFDAATGTWTPTLDNSIADRLGKVGSDANGPMPNYRSLVVGLGVQGQALAREKAMDQALKADASAMWQAVSGVNLDEEMTNLMSYQRAYEAASRVVNSVDAMLDKLINGTGLVGR